MSMTSGRPLRRPYMTFGRPPPPSMRMPMRWSLPSRSNALNWRMASSPRRSKSTQLASRGRSASNCAAALSNWCIADVTLVPPPPGADVCLPDGQTSTVGASIAAAESAGQTATMAPPMQISPVRRMRVPEEIVRQIRGFIASGELRPSDQLPSERELAERFQVSRASIREALTAMQVMGLLERSRTGGGLAARGNHVWFTIAPLSTFLATRSHIIEQIEVRRMIEPEMGRLAADRAGPSDIERMEHCLADMEADIDAG